MTPSGILGPGATVLLVAATVAVVTVAGPSTVAAWAGGEDGPTTIDSCTTISEPGRYVLAGDLASDDDAACVRIDASDVVLDGDGHAIEGASTASDVEAATTDSLPPRTTVGVSVNASTPLSNVTVRNVTVRGWFYGIAYEDVSTVVVRDSLATGNGVGVYVLDSRDVRLENVTSTDNAVSGVRVEYSGGTATNASRVG